MNKKPTELPNLAIPPAESEVKCGMLNCARGSGLINSLEIPPISPGERFQRFMFAEKWINENPDLVRDLEQWSKDELIRSLLREIVGQSYDKHRAEIETVDDFREHLKAFLVLGEVLRKGTPDEQRLALDKWETERIARAGNNTKWVAEIASAAGATRVRINESPKIKAFKVREAILAEGRRKGVEHRKKTAAEKRAVLTKAIEDLFDTPAKPGWAWSNSEIAQFLLEGGHKYKKSTILQAVKREKAKSRRTRKMQLASKFPKR